VPPKLGWSSPICWSRTSRIFSISSTLRAWKKNSTKLKKASRQGMRRNRVYHKFSKISDTPRSTWKTSSVWRSRRMKSVNSAARRWLSSGQARFVLCLQHLRQGKSRHLQVHQRESINLPDLDSADLQETAQEEYCENCGRVMVLKRGRFGQFMACTGYPIARQRGGSIRARKCPTFRSMKPVHCANAT